MGVVVGETAEIGDGCTIYQGVTWAEPRCTRAKAPPTLGKDVVVSAGAKVLGGFEVGDGAKIGSNAVVIKPVPAGATAVGIPARIIPSKGAKRRRDRTRSNRASSRPTASPRKTTPVAEAMRGLIDNASFARASDRLAVAGHRKAVGLRQDRGLRAGRRCAQGTVRSRQAQRSGRQVARTCHHSMQKAPQQMLQGLF